MTSPMGILILSFALWFGGMFFSYRLGHKIGFNEGYDDRRPLFELAMAKLDKCHEVLRNKK